MSLVSVRGAALGLAAVLAAFVAAVSAGHEGHSHEDPGKPMIVKIHADWCGTCQKLEATFEELQTQIGNQALLVVLDVTDEDAVARSAARADELGIRAFFDRYKGETGTVGVLTGRGEPVAVMRGVTDTARYLAAVRAAQEA